MVNTIQTIPLSLGVTNIILALIIGLHFKKDQMLKGCIGWGTGIFLLGLRLLVPAFENFFTIGIVTDAIANTLFVASALLIYYGTLRFFDNNLPKQNLLIFSIAYLLVTFFLIAVENTQIQGALSALSVSMIAGLNAGLILKQNNLISKKLIHFLFSIFLFYALFFLAICVHFFISAAGGSFIMTALIPSAIYLVIVVSSILWTLGFVFLINERTTKKADEVKEIYDLTINTIPDAVLITRLKDGLIVKVNNGFSKLTGYTKKDISGKTTLDLKLWEDPTERQKLIILLTDTGSVENKGPVFRRKSGKTFNGLLSARTIILFGEPHILCVVQDITSRKKMEDKLRENEEKYRFLTESSSDVIWHINKSYRIDYISPADETIRGFKREEVFGQPIWHIFKPEGIKLIRDKIEHHRQVEQVGNNRNITRFEIEQRCKDGKWIWTEITAAPHYDNHGNLIGYHGISRDISELRHLLEQLHNQATIDELTQVPNRRHFMTLSEQELKRSKRYHHPVSLIIFDFNNLKGINDTYGHLAGDRALLVFAKIVRTLIREVDILGRFGGDEFLLLLPETNQHQARYVLERIHQVLSASPVIFQDNQYSISISAGVASLNDWTDSLEDLFKRADKDLYIQKNHGGDDMIDPPDSAL